MIRTVPIPTSVNRLAAAYSVTPGCMSYQNPNTGLWETLPSYDVNGNLLPAANCNFGDGQSIDSPLPDDPGLQNALELFAASGRDAANQQALNSATNPASLVLANSLMSGNIPSPLPGLGLTIPDPVKNWLEIAAIAAIAYFVLVPSARESRRSRA